MGRRILILALMVLAVVACGSQSDKYGSTSAVPTTGGAPWYKVDLDPDQDLVQPYILEGDTHHYLVEPCYLFLDNQHYLFYEVDEIDLGADAVLDSVIHFATSDDGISWELANSGAPVLVPDQEWETGGVGAPAVVRRDGVFVMFYAAGNGAGFGYAESADGVNWVKYDANPVLAPDQQWEGGVVGAPAVIHHKGSFRLYYSGGLVGGSDLALRAGTAIGYAQSDDGIGWTKRDGDGRDSEADGDQVAPIITATQEWEMYTTTSGVVASPFVRVDHPVERDIYRLYYTGNLVGDFVLHDVGIGVASSLDGVNFEKMNEISNPVINERFPLTIFGASQYIVYGEFAPSVIKKGNSYRMIFSQTDILEAKQGLALAVHPRPDSL